MTTYRVIIVLQLELQQYSCIYSKWISKPGNFVKQQNISLCLSSVFCMWVDSYSNDIEIHCALQIPVLSSEKLFLYSWLSSWTKNGVNLIGSVSEYVQVLYSTV